MDNTPPYPPTARTTGFPPVSRWHPKMSPYRISVITTTVILGTSKAIFTNRGISIVSTTLEWIAGVVFTLLFFAFDELESKGAYPKRLNWFFTFDCTEVMWKSLNILSIPRPRYRSDEKENLHSSTFAPMTGYRILVSATIIALGSTKAALAFLGQNTTANYLDWILAVLVTALLYYIGLCESNSINMAPNFFDHDHHIILSRIGRDVVFTLGLGVCFVASVVGFIASLSRFQNDFSEMISGVAESDSLVLGLLVLFAGIFWTCTSTLIVALSFASIVASLLLMKMALQEEAELFRSLFRHGGKIAKYYDNLTARAVSMIALPANFLDTAARVAWSILRAGIHLFGIIALGSLLLGSFFSMTLIARLVGETFYLYGFGGIGKAMILMAMLLGIGYTTILVLWGVYALICSIFFLPYTSLPDVFYA